MDKTETRNRQRPLKVWVSPSERTEIERLAESTGLSLSAYLRNVGLGYQPPSMFDNEVVHELAKLHADQGRLGGLLKLWLSDQPGKGAPTTEVRAVLREIEGVERQLRDLITRICL